MLLCVLPLVEQDALSVFSQNISPACWGWVILSALLAFLVNLSLFLVIGRTSPVSYNVLGHTKLCVILLGGYLLFGDAASPKNLVGVACALIGIFWYFQ